MSYLTLLATVLLALTRPGHGSYNFIRCGECDESRCPELHYCEGQAIKDHCGCCTVCSSSKFQPHVMISHDSAGNACDQVKCPKLKVCVVNMQGLPLCTCPSLHVCRGAKKREVCGTDDQSYESRCHLRIASCNEGVTVRKKHRGPCNEENEESRTRAKKLKKRRRRRRKDDEEDAYEEKQRRRKEKKRRRRKSGRSRARRHRGKKQATGKNFEEAFSHYTWKA